MAAGEELRSHITGPSFPGWSKGPFENVFLRGHFACSKFSCAVRRIVVHRLEFACILKREVISKHLKLALPDYRADVKSHQQIRILTIPQRPLTPVALLQEEYPSPEAIMLPAGKA